MVNNYLCRLCSSKSNIVDIYDSKLECGEELRLYIKLASGIEIEKDDPISRMVCHRCCEIAVKLYEYRSNAIANDKSLKNKVGQRYTPPITDEDELTRVASRISHDSQSDQATGGDPLDLLNVYIKDKQLQNSDVIVNKPPGVNKNDVLPAIESKSNASDRVRETGDGQMHSKTNKSVNASMPTANKTGDGLKSSVRTIPPLVPRVTVTSKIVPKAKVDSSKNIPLRVRSTSAYSGNSESSNESIVEKRSVKNISTSQTIKLRFSKQDIRKHRSVQTLLAQNKSLILPTHVYSSDISPVISLDRAEVSNWYETEFRLLKEKLAEATNYQRDRSQIFDDEEESGPLPRLRKRNFRQIIIDSESEDDHCSLPNKISRSDKIVDASSITLIKLLEDAPHKIIDKEKAERIKKATVNQKNFSNVRSGHANLKNSSTVIPEQSNLKNNVETQPVGVLSLQSDGASSISKPTPSVSNSSVLHTMLQTPNANTAPNLYSDFSKYGINIENSEPLLDFVNNIDPLLISNAIPSDLEQIICISDDEETLSATDLSTTGKQSRNNGEKDMIGSLFKKHSNHLHQSDKDCQTFKASNAIIHRTKLDLVALENMLSELKRHKIPIELEFSRTNNAHFVENVKTNNRVLAKFWSLGDCVDLGKQKPSTNVIHKLPNGFYHIIKSRSNVVSAPSKTTDIPNVIKTRSPNILPSPTPPSQLTTTTVKSFATISTASTSISGTSSGQFNNSPTVYSYIPITVKNMNVSLASEVPRVYESNTNLTPTTTTTFNNLSTTSPVAVTTTGLVVQSNLPTVNSVSSGSPSYLLKSFLLADQPSLVEKPPHEKILVTSGALNQTYVSVPPTYSQWPQTTNVDTNKCKIRVKNLSELMQ